LRNSFDYLLHMGPPLGVLPPRTEPAGLPFVSLSGSWEFHLASGNVEVPPDFERGVGEAPGQILVPSHWQLQGHGRPQYTNVEYPFPINVPHVPDENPVGSYRRRFALPDGWTGGRIVLRLEGVDSTAKVWLNGVDLGLTVGSRVPHEFDVTTRVRPGENLLAVRVHQWSAASYLEDQDMWWLSGLFRDVRLCYLPAGVPADVRVTADYRDRSGAITVVSDQPGHFQIDELGVEGALGEQTILAAVEPWSAESPRLYTVKVHGPGGTVSVRTGFRTVSTEGGVFRVNGRRTVLRGVNRHDFHPERGRAVTRQDMLADVLMLKRHNINALRTAHYPPDPYLLDLCDEYGLYVIDECDVETHGFGDFGWDGNPSDDPHWTEAMLARMRSMVTRDRNHPSIVLWSLGNESHTGVNLAAMAAWTKAADPSRPLHYEGDQVTAYTDIWSQMYPAHRDVEVIARRAEPALADLEMDAARRAKPYLMCEYGHAMGNGPGGLLEYRQIIESSERCMGAFAWELIDHGLTMTNASGTTVTAYGGDFGEPIHSGNFCCDGLLFADRTPSPAMAELAAVNAPVRIDLGSQTMTVTNAYDHVDTAHVSFTWKLMDEGEALDTGWIAMPPVAAGGSVTVPLPQAAIGTRNGETVLEVAALLAVETPWAAPGHELAYAQRVLTTPAPRQRATFATASARERFVQLGVARFDTASGRLVALGDLPVEGPWLELWRAPTDNDLRSSAGEPAAVAWSRLGLHRLTHRLARLECTDDEITTVVRTAAPHRREAVVTTYRWSHDGAGLLCAVSIEPEGDWSTSPVARIGWRLDLPTDITRVIWYGLGPGEAYVDSCHGARLGRYERSITEMHTPYARPQENGQRLGVRWADLGPLRISGGVPFGLTISRYSRHQLATTAHDAALLPEDRLYCHIDLHQHGLGSSSCGPEPLPQHALFMKAQTFTLQLVPRQSTFIR
jgi:beta-galactosidase